MVILLKLQTNIIPLAHEFFTRNLLYFKFNCIDVIKQGFLDLQKNLVCVVHVVSYFTFAKKNTA